MVCQPPDLPLGPNFHGAGPGPQAHSPPAAPSPLLAAFAGPSLLLTRTASPSRPAHHQPTHMLSPTKRRTHPHLGDTLAVVRRFHEPRLTCAPLCGSCHTLTTRWVTLDLSYPRMKHFYSVSCDPKAIGLNTFAGFFSQTPWLILSGGLPTQPALSVCPPTCLRTQRHPVPPCQMVSLLSELFCDSVPVSFPHPLAAASQACRTATNAGLSPHRPCRAGHTHWTPSKLMTLFSVFSTLGLKARDTQNSNQGGPPMPSDRPSGPPLCLESPMQSRKTTGDCVNVLPHGH